MTPGLIASVTSSPSNNSVVFSPDAGHNYGPVYGVYTATGKGDDMRNIAYEYCMMGTNSGPLTQDTKLVNEAITIKCEE